MTKQEILQNIYKQLRLTSAIRNKQDFAEKIGYNYTCTSSALNGNERYLNDRFFTRILRAFPQVSEEYIKTGQGDVLIIGLEKGELLESPLTGILPLSSHNPSTNAPVDLRMVLHALEVQQELTRRQQAQTETILEELNKLIELIRTISNAPQR